MKRTSTAKWHGTIREGKGTLSTQSPALYNLDYSYGSRFEEGIGTNPEELIAAAHAGCFSMAFSLGLSNAGFTPESIETSCTITLENLTITSSHLKVKANVPGIDQESLNRIANDAKSNCPVSRVLNLEITMELEPVHSFQATIH